MPARAGTRAVARGRIRDRDLDLPWLEANTYLCAAVAVAGGVSERLLQDPVDSPGDAGRERPRLAAEVHGDGQPSRPVALDELLEGVRTRCGKLRLVPLAQRPHQPVDLADSAARDLLDGGDRAAGPGRIALTQQAG